MKKRKAKEQLTITEVAAQRHKRKRRTKAEMEAARALAVALKRETVEAVYPVEGYPMALCPVCRTVVRGDQRKRVLDDLVEKHKGMPYVIHRSVYPCARLECKTDVICFISHTLNQRDILFFLDQKRLSGDEHKAKLPTVTRHNARSIGQPTTVTRGAIETAPVEAVKKKKKAVKRKR
jgi:hypothetical protein